MEPASPHNIVSWTIVGTVSAVSLLGNGFIIVVEGHQWLQNRKMLPCDVFLTSLSISRFLMQLLSSLNYVLHLIPFGNYLYSSKHEVVYFSWTFFNMASLWSATWLNVFYCVKVTNFANRLFLWLKPRINMLAPRLLGMSIIISTIFSLPPVVENFVHKRWANQTENLLGSANLCKFFREKIMILLPLHIVFNSINFCMSIVASTLLLTSLWKHTRHLKKSGVGDKDLSTQVHINVMIPLLFYVFFYFLYFMGIMIKANSALTFGKNDQLLVEILMSTFPSAHSIIIILTNPKLKEIVVHILNFRHRAS